MIKQEQSIQTANPTTTAKSDMWVRQSVNLMPFRNQNRQPECQKSPSVGLIKELSQRLS